jgi:hemoglobin
MNPAEPDAPTPYQLLGGDARVRELVERFYDLMELDPAYARLREVHGSSLESAPREALSIPLRLAWRPAALHR